MSQAQLPQDFVRDVITPLETRIAQLERALRITPNVYELAADSFIDVPIAASDRLLIVHWELLFTSNTQLRAYPNNDTGTVYSYVIGGSGNYNNSYSSRAASGEYNANGGIKLSGSPAGAITGSIRSTGSAEIGLRVQSNARICSSRAAVSSTVSGGQQMVEAQQIASLWLSNAAITSVRLTCSAGNMTGCIWTEVS